MTPEQYQDAMNGLKRTPSRRLPEKQNYEEGSV